MKIFFVLHDCVPLFILAKYLLFYYSSFQYFILQAYQFMVSGTPSFIFHIPLAVIALVFHIPLSVLSVLCYRNFDKGLTDKRNANQADINWDAFLSETDKLINPQGNV